MRRLDRLSFSQLSTYAECGEKYRLTKGYGLGESTWWATLAGSAVHELTALYDETLAYDKPDMQYLTLFGERFTHHAEDAERKNLEIKASGRLTKEVGFTGGPNKKDRGWWLHWGPLMLEAYAQWRAHHHWEVARVLTDQGPRLAVEAEFRENLGGVQVAGSIDRIFWDPDLKRHIVVDLKTGNEPGGRMQLATYRLAALRMLGLNIAHAAYISPYVDKETGELRWGGKVHDMSAWSPAYVDHQYRMAQEGIRASIFLPNTGACRSCPVTDYCRAQEGVGAWEYPVIESKAGEVELAPPGVKV